MLNLAYPIEDTVEIDGVEYELNLAFDNVLRLLDMLNDVDLSDAAQIIIGIEMLLGVNLELDIERQEEIFYELFKSTVGKEVEESAPVDIEGNPMPQEDKEKVYSLKEDAEYIFSSFYQDYGVDLFEMQGKLHWYKFQAMLSGLKSDTKFKEVIEIRTMDLPSGKGSEKQRKQVIEAKEAYKLKDS